MLNCASILRFALGAYAVIQGSMHSRFDAGEPKTVPRVQAIPLHQEQVSFAFERKELTRLYFGPTQQRPFLFPVNGHSGISLTRMGHPHDPVSHSHHNSV